jgi:hypothetical protein
MIIFVFAVTCVRFIIYQSNLWAFIIDLLTSELGPIHMLNFPASALVSLSIVQNFNLSLLNTKVTLIDCPGVKLTLVKSFNSLTGLVKLPTKSRTNNITISSALTAPVFFTVTEASKLYPKLIVVLDNLKLV